MYTPLTYQFDAPEDQDPYEEIMRLPDGQHEYIKQSLERTVGLADGSDVTFHVAREWDKWTLTISHESGTVTLPVDAETAEQLVNQGFSVLARVR